MCLHSHCIIHLFLSKIGFDFSRVIFLFFHTVIGLKPNLDYVYSEKITIVVVSLRTLLRTMSNTQNSELEELKLPSFI